MYYEKLREHYYTLFPEEKKLEFGCELLIKGKSHFIGLPYDEDQTFVMENTNCKENDCFVADLDFYSMNDFVEILGKPLTLQMVLRMLNDEYFIYGSGKIMRYSEEHLEDLYYVKLDLSKELKDQDEETLKKLYELCN